MMMDIIYIEQKLREFRELREAGSGTRHRDWIEPGSEVPRTGAGRVHEVFRRIVQDAEPVRPRHVPWLRPRKA